MEARQRALDGHAEKLGIVKANAERLEDAVAGGQNLRVVVSASRTLRHDLAELLADFQASPEPCTLHPAPLHLAGLASRLQWPDLRSPPSPLSPAGSQGQPGQGYFSGTLSRGSDRRC